MSFFFFFFSFSNNKSLLKRNLIINLFMRQIWPMRNFLHLTHMQSVCYDFFTSVYLSNRKERKNQDGTRHEKNIVRANRALTRCLFYSCVNSGVFSLNKTAVVARTWLIGGNLIVLDESSYECFHFPPESKNKQWFVLEEDNFANIIEEIFIFM